MGSIMDHPHISQPFSSDTPRYTWWECWWPSPCRPHHWPVRAPKFHPLRLGICVWKWGSTPQISWDTYFDSWRSTIKIRATLFVEKQTLRSSGDISGESIPFLLNQCQKKMIASLGRWQSRYKIYKLAWHSTGYQGFHLYLRAFPKSSNSYHQTWPWHWRARSARLGITISLRKSGRNSELSWTTKSVERTASLKIQTAHGFARESRNIWQTDLAVVLANQGTCLNQRILSKPSQSI